MSEERVDKAWRRRGLEEYSVGAILGTLRHYGVAVDEPGFKALASERFPIEIAHDWSAAWKGTGQFSHFHWAAANELWKRLQSDRLAPSDYAAAVVTLLHALGHLVDGSLSAPVGGALKTLEALKPRVPLKDDRPVERFVEEVMLLLGEGVQLFSKLPPDLAQAGHVDDAESLVELEEFLFPDARGFSRAMMRHARGEREEALKDLEALGQDASRKPSTRLMAVDGLIQLEELERAGQIGKSLLDTVEKEKDFHLALELSERLEFVFRKTGNRAEHARLVERVEALEQEHAEAHPGH